MFQNGRFELQSDRFEFQDGLELQMVELCF